MLWGGRGAGRSWGVARALLIIGTMKPIRVLCARELQNSISESVHRVLADQITNLGLDKFYEVQVNRILGVNGTSFSFEGVKNNVNKIKSYEGIDYCWVEEANKVTRNSWGILIPTIRKEESEIWITFNPELETDYTYDRFVKQADPASMIVTKMTWKDNPWFPQVLMEEMERDKVRDYDHYLNIWEGFCRQTLEGAVYAKELRKAREEGRITKVPWDKGWPVDTFWDLGRADATAIWFVQRVAQQWRVLSYYSASFEDLTHFISECKKKPYIYDTMWLPHDAKAKKLGTKQTIEEQIRDYGYTVRIVPNISRTDGINAARMVFNQCWFDEDECYDGIQALSHYRYKVVEEKKGDDSTAQFSNDPIHDWASDGADAFRYFAVASTRRKEKSNVGQKLMEAAAAVIAKRSERTADAGRAYSTGRHGWMR